MKGERGRKRDKNREEEEWGSKGVRMDARKRETVRKESIDGKGRKDMNDGRTREKMGERKERRGRGGGGSRRERHGCEIKGERGEKRRQREKAHSQESSFGSCDLLSLCHMV